MSSVFAQPLLDTEEWIAVDLFAGGGGASLGYEMATGRPVDIAINHNSSAIAMHERNHPHTKHHISDIFEVNPRIASGGRKVGLLWASPDCTHHSKARGGKPFRNASRKRRALAWVVLWWAATVRPRTIFLENVEEFLHWGPLVGLPENLRPCKKRRGKTFKRFVQLLRLGGYKVEWGEMRACDYGAPTIRKRLFLVARCDDEPIEFPAPTHGDPLAKGFDRRRLLPWRSAGSCIDWSLPWCSVFASKDEAREWAREHGKQCPIRPLAEKSMGRIARGLKVHVLESARPYLVPLTHTGARRIHSIDRPITTITGAHRGETAIAAPIFTPYVGGVGGRSGQSPERSAADPLGTITSKGDMAVMTPAIINVANSKTTGRGPNAWSAYDPLRTITTGNGFAVVAAHLSTYYGYDGATHARIAKLNEPLRTQGTENRFAVIAAGLQTYYGTSQDSGLAEPLPTVTTKDRHSVFASFLSTNVGGFAEDNSGRGRPLWDPVATITAKGANHSLVGVFFDRANGGFENRVGRSAHEPLATILTEGRGHSGLLAVSMVQSNFGDVPTTDASAPLRTIVAGGTHHALMGAYLQRDFGNSVGQTLYQPAGTITSTGNGKASMVAALLERHFPSPERAVESVTLTIDKIRYVVVDIMMRMLTPRELFRCQGFPDSYVIDCGADGKPLTATEQVHMCGNSVSPWPAMALIAANAKHMVARPWKEIWRALNDAYRHGIVRLAS